MHEKAFLNSLRPSTRNILSGVFKNSPDTVYVWMEGKSATKYLCIRQTNLYNVMEDDMIDEFLKRLYSLLQYLTIF